MRRLAAGAAFPVLSANVVDAAGKTPFRHWVVKEAGGLRVGIFGLSGSQAPGLPNLPGHGLIVQDPVAAARAAVAGLRPGVDLVIALSQLGLEADARLAGEVPGIDVILGGFDRKATPMPRIAGSTLILQSGAKGMQLGRLGLQILPGREGAWTARHKARGREARVYDWTLVQLNTALPDHPDLAALLDRHREELRARNLAEQATAPASRPRPQNPPTSARRPAAPATRRSCASGPTAGTPRPWPR